MGEIKSSAVFPFYFTIQLFCINNQYYFLILIIFEIWCYQIIGINV